MKLSINKIRAIVFMVAAFGYLPLQSAEHGSEKQDLKNDVQVEKVEKTTAEPVADLAKG